MVRTLLAALGCTLLVGPALAADPAPAGPRPLRVGFICPFTGGSQDFGNAARLGAELAAAEINQAGGYMGRPMELVARDDQANPDEGRKIAEELVVQRQADFTIGYCNTGVALKSLDVFQQHKHLLMVAVATGTQITTRFAPAESYVFHLSPRDTLQAGFLVQELLKKGLTRIAVFADKTGYGEGGLKDVERLLAEKALKPVYVGRFDLGVTSLTTPVAEAKAAGAEAIISYTVGPEQVVMARARAEARFGGPLFGPWTLSFRSVGDKAGSAIEGASMPQTIIQDIAHERRTSFIARLRKHAGTQPVASLMAAAEAYDAVHLMLRAVFQTRGDTSGPALKQALENLERPYAGVVTTYERPFTSADHDAISSNMLWMGTWRRGDIHFYEPEDAKRAATIQRKAG